MGQTVEEGLDEIYRKQIADAYLSGQLDRTKAVTKLGADTVEELHYARRSVEADEEWGNEERLRSQSSSSRCPTRVLSHYLSQQMRCRGPWIVAGICCIITRVVPIVYCRPSMPRLVRHTPCLA